MKINLIETSYRLIDGVSLSKKRYLYDNIDFNCRLSGVVGARGTGKTTMMLQYIKEKIGNPDKAIYISADNIYFASNLLFEFIRQQYEIEARDHFFIDEIHKYPNWNRELKNIYDSFPEIKVVFSGSSSIALEKGSYDLSRRALLYKLEPMSFREYIDFVCGVKLPTVSIDEITNSHQQLSREITSKVPNILKHFKDYLCEGFYPFFFEHKESFSQRLLSVIEKTVYDDIASFYSMKTDNLPILKKIIFYLSTIEPGTVSINNMAKSLGVDNKTVSHYIEMLNSAGLLRKVAIDKKGSAMIRANDKIFLNNPNMYHSIIEQTGKDPSVGTVREVCFISMIQGAGKTIFYSKEGDYRVDDSIFEIGGRNKDFSQIKNSKDSFLAKDDVKLSTSKKEIPLYLFGFLY